MIWIQVAVGPVVKNKAATESANTMGGKSKGAKGKLEGLHGAGGMGRKIDEVSPALMQGH